MSTTIAGVVRNGVVIPDAPLPEGANVQIQLEDDAIGDIPPELRDELAAWQQASAQSLELVERLAQESEGNEER